MTWLELAHTSVFALAKPFTNAIGLDGLFIDLFITNLFACKLLALIVAFTGDLMCACT